MKPPCSTAKWIVKVKMSTSDSRKSITLPATPSPSKPSPTSPKQFSYSSATKQHTDGLIIRLWRRSSSSAPNSHRIPSPPSPNKIRRIAKPNPPKRIPTKRTQQAAKPRPPKRQRTKKRRQQPIKTRRLPLQNAMKEAHDSLFPLLRPSKVEAER